MNFRYTNLFLAALLCGAGEIARAQLPFFENFDAMRADSYDWNSQGRLLAGEFDYGDDEAPPRVRGARDGVTPYSGNRMFEMRASVYKDRIRTMRLHVDSIHRASSPGIEFTLNFYVPSSYANVNTLIMDTPGQGVRTGSLFFNLADNKFDYMSGTIQKHDKSFNFSVPKDQWNKLRIRITWADSMLRSYFNDAPLVSTPIETDMFGFLGGPRFGVIPQQNTSSSFSPFGGAPGYFVDDITLVSVPEPSCLGAFVIMIGCLIGKRGWRKIAI